MRDPMAGRRVAKRRDFSKAYERHLRKSRHVLYLWREQEGLSYVAWCVSE